MIAAASSGIGGDRVSIVGNRGLPELPLFEGLGDPVVGLTCIRRAVPGVGLERALRPRVVAETQHDQAPQ